MRRKAPVQLTGGGGFRYENSVAARFLLDLLAGTNTLGADFGRIAHVDRQARDDGWLADDLAVDGPGLRQTGAATQEAAGMIGAKQKMDRGLVSHAEGCASTAKPAIYAPRISVLFPEG